MKSDAVSKEKRERRKKVLAMGRDQMPVQRIAELVSTPRQTVIRWLESAGIEPVMLRERKKESGRPVSLRNTPLALEIDRRVQQRIERESEGK